MIEQEPLFEAPPAAEAGAWAGPRLPSLPEVLLAGWWQRYPHLISLRCGELRTPVPRLLHHTELPPAERYALGLIGEVVYGELTGEPLTEELLEEPLPESPEALEAEREPRQRDPWRTYVQIGPGERDVLAATRWPFRVSAVRLWREREGLTRWHVLIQQAPLGVYGVLRLPAGNAARDRQLAWLRDERAAGRHADLVLCLFHEPAGRYRRLALTRTAWLAPDAVTLPARLPEDMRARLLRGPGAPAPDPL